MVVNDNAPNQISNGAQWFFASKLAPTGLVHSPRFQSVRATMPDQTPPQVSPPRALRWAVAGSVIVMIAAGGLFYYAAQLAAAKRER